MSARTTMTLQLDDVSTLLGLVRMGLDDAIGALEDARDSGEAETLEWYEDRRRTLTRLEGRLTRAGVRLTRRRS